MDIKEILKMSISTLNTVRVSGEEDMGAQLGVIRALKTVVKVLDQPEPGEGQEEETNG